MKIYEYRPTFIHSKFVVVDENWSVIGSPNLNSRSRQLDEENAFAILDAGLAGQLEQAFFRDVGTSDQISLDNWRKRSPALRTSSCSRGYSISSREARALLRQRPRRQRGAGGHEQVLASVDHVGRRRRAVQRRAHLVAPEQFAGP